MGNKKKISVYICVLVVLATIISDLISKHYSFQIDKNIIPGFISFKYAQNTGAAYSMFSNSTTFLIIISIIAIAFLSIYTCISKNESIFFHVSLGLILGGAIGNLFDRVFFGYVRDFIKLDFVNFPIFNLADSFLTIGVSLLFLHYLIEIFREMKEKNKKI